MVGSPPLARPKSQMSAGPSAAEKGDLEAALVEGGSGLFESGRRGVLVLTFTRSTLLLVPVFQFS